MHRRLILALAVVLLLDGHFSLAAQATISGITVSQAQPARGETATVTISGSGSLSGLSFTVLGYTSAYTTTGSSAIGAMSRIFGPVVLTSWPMVIPVTFPSPPSVELEVDSGGSQSQIGAGSPVKVLRRQSVTVVWPLVTDIAPPSTGIVPGRAATITIVGRGKPCPTLTVDFGDGTGLITLSNVGLPLPVQHNFAKGGSFTVSVRTTPNEGCTGQASRIVNVVAPKLTGEVVPTPEL